MCCKRYFNKRYSTLEQHLGVQGFHIWLKSLPFIVIGWNPGIKKRVNNMSYIEWKGVLKDIHCIAQNVARFVDLL